MSTAEILTLWSFDSKSAPHGHAARVAETVLLSASHSTRSSAKRAPGFQMGMPSCHLSENNWLLFQIKFNARYQDVRSIFEAVVQDTIDKRDVPRSSLFRTGPVVIEDARGRIKHEGVEPCLPAQSAKVLLYILQLHLMSGVDEIRQADVSASIKVSIPTVRSALRELAAREILVQISQRPPVFRLTEQATKLITR